jgi:uncharacterized protein GlcG (DUF336 family)
MLHHDSLPTAPTSMTKLRPRVVVAGILAAALLVQPAMADDVVTTHRLSAAIANEIVAEVVAACAKQGYAETAVVVDADGVRQAELRGDRAGAHSLDSANDKAYTSASFKTDTSALVERAKGLPAFVNLFKLPHLLLFGGGIVVKLGDEVVGAVGAAGAPGSDLDEGCARAGLDKVKDRLK